MGKYSRRIDSQIIPIVLWFFKEKLIRLSKIWINSSEKPYDPVKVKMDFGWINRRSTNLHLIVFWRVSGTFNTGSRHLKSFKYKVFKDFTK
jgi:hypothetical protein